MRINKRPFSHFATGLLSVLPLLVLLAGCDRPDVIRDLGQKSFSLIDQDSAKVIFPEDFNGDITVVGFIYTHCPHICPAITANLKRTAAMLDSNSGIQFAEITFDPERDTPRVLREYMNNRNLSDSLFTLLTGRPAVVDTLMNALGIYAVKSDTATAGSDPENYLMTHTNRISLIDRQGRIRGEYNGSRVDPARIIEDINNLR